jgi:hypothetical protein
MNILWSSLEQAHRDLLVHSAQDESFRRLSYWYDFVYQYGFEESAWRRALLELAFGRRGTKRTTFNVVRHVLRQYDEVFKVKVDPATPNVLTFVECLKGTIENPNPTAFDFTHVNRYITTPYGTVRSAGPVLCGSGNPQTSTTLTLYPAKTFYWDKPQDIWPSTWVPGQEYTFEVRVLPFQYYEWQPGPAPTVAAGSGLPETNPNYYVGEPCLVEVYIQGNILPNVPTTYLQADGALTQAGVPYGGNLLDDEFVQGNPGGLGPHPLYLVSQNVFESVRDQIQASLAAGVTLHLLRAPMYVCTP